MVFGLCILFLIHTMVVLYFMLKDLQVFIDLKTKFTEFVERYDGTQKKKLEIEKQQSINEAHLPYDSFDLSIIETPLPYDSIDIVL